MRKETVMDGRFEVNDIGEVYRLSGGNRELAVQSRTGNGGKYRVVTCYIDGKQKSIYVHRLIAEAFIPNPDNLPEVNHIDGNPGNNRAENLEWCTRSDNASHAFRTGLINPYRNAQPCVSCGELTRAKDSICTACKKALKSRAKAEDKTAGLRDEMLLVDQNLLTPIEARYVALRQEGLSYSEIGAVYGVSRQCVEQAIRNAKGKRAPQRTVTAQKEIFRLESRMKKKRAVAEQLSQEKALVDGEISRLEANIERLAERLYSGTAAQARESR